eukprot:12824268-Ditylum_brightwellii.AAC.1
MAVRQPLLGAILSTLALPCITLQQTETNVRSRVTGSILSHNRAVPKKRDPDSRNTIKTTRGLRRRNGSTLDTFIQISETIGNLELENKNESEEEYVRRLSNSTGQVLQPPIANDTPDSAFVGKVILVDLNGN